MSLTLPEQQLVDVLKTMPPNSVYLDAGKKEVIRGFSLCADGRLSELSWEKDGVLVARLAVIPVNVSESHTAVVRLFLEGQELKTICSCAVHGVNHRCEHAICVLMTVIHLLRPDVFKMTQENRLQRARLEATLLKRPVPVPGWRSETGQPYEGAAEHYRSTNAEPDFQIIIEDTGKGLKAFVEMDGERLGVNADFRSLPWEIAYLARSSHHQDMSYPLALFLRRARSAYPLFYAEGSRRHVIEWLNESQCSAWTEIEAVGEEITVRRAASIGKYLKQRASLIGNFAFDQKRTVMCHIAERDGWRWWYLLSDLHAGYPDGLDPMRESAATDIHVPVKNYREFQLSLRKSREKETLKFLKCMEGGEVVPLLTVKADHYRLKVSRDTRDKDFFVIEPECKFGSYSFKPSRRIILFARAIEGGVIPASLRTKKRKPILYTALFDALQNKGRKAIGAVLRETVNEDSFGKRHFASRARSIIRESVDAFRADELQLHFTDQGWRLISLDKEKETLLFLVLYAVFGSSIFEHIDGGREVLRVKEEDLLDHLHSLQERSARDGIELSFEDYPVELVNWELELDARSGTIDWFEIRPEIRSSGRTIPREVWERALARKGLIVHEGKIQILSEKSLKALSALNRVLGGTKTRRGARQVTTMPRLRIIDLFALRKEGISVLLSDEDEAIIKRLTNFRTISEQPAPDGLAGRLRHYQKQGYDWLAFLYEHRFGACLADDMGLGKTLQAIALLAGIKEGKVGSHSRSAGPLPFLIVVPPTLIFNWEREIAIFYPDLKVYVYRGRERSTEISEYDVVITSYGLIRRDIGKLKHVLFEVIIFDEAQAIKNIFADTTSAVRQLKGVFKVALTGTPVENHIGEYFSIMDLVLPGLFGDYRDFQGKARDDLQALLPLIKERSAPFMLRRTKERILKELPPKVEHDVYLELSEEQKKFYNRTVAEVRSTIEAAYRSNTASQARIIALTAIMKLRQICLTPKLLVPDLKVPSPKIDFLKDKLEELFSESHSALVFSQFTSFLDLVEEELRSTDVPFFRLDGRTPVAKRKGIVEAFQESRTPAVFLLSLKAGGQGLNLTRATYVFHLDPWWNPAVENQASDRSHRIGQLNKVIVTRLLTRHTVEEKMMALKQRKQSLYRALMEAPERSGGRMITREDLEFLISPK